MRTPIGPEFLRTQHGPIMTECICMSSSRIRKGDIYHLVAERGNYTLCGLRISPFNLAKKKDDSETETSSSASELLCKHCERIEKQG
jgi:hypothetical protein